MIFVHPVLATVLVLGFAIFVFWRVGIDYASRGSMSLISAVLQFFVFLLHALSSYSYVDSRLSTVDKDSPLVPMAVALMGVGLVLTLAAMAQLRGATFGRVVSGLRESGVYRFTRNPQLVAYFVFLAGYALLWPSWSGAAWLAVYCVIAHMMALTEERHLRRVFGAEYEAYCRRTPRYVGLPGDR